jgi:hypothetical protein
MYLNHRNNWLMVLKNSPFWYLLFITPPRLLLDVIASVAYLRTHGITGFLVVYRAWKWIGMHQSQVRDARKSAGEKQIGRSFWPVFAQMDPIPVVFRRVFKLTS